MTKPINNDEWEQLWGEHARTIHENVGLKTAILVDRRFRNSVLRRAVVKKHGSYNPSTLAQYATDALEAWARARKDATSRITPEDLDLVEKFIPRPAGAAPGSRVRADLTGRLPESQFSRILATYCEASAAGKATALRFALRDALVAALLTDKPAESPES